MKQPRNADRIITILTDRIKVLELEKAYLLDDLLTAQEKLKEGSNDGNDSN